MLYFVYPDIYRSSKLYTFCAFIYTFCHKKIPHRKLGIFINIYLKLGGVFVKYKQLEYYDKKYTILVLGDDYL